MQSAPISYALSFAFSLVLVATAAAQGPSSARFSQDPIQADQADQADSSAVEGATRIETLDEQLALLLESRDPDLQSTAMTLVIEFRRQAPGTYDLTRCISPLLQVYRSDRQEGMRLLALATLHEIGTRRVYDALRASFQETRSERVRRQTALVLHYAKAHAETHAKAHAEAERPVS
ncbi:HEAT repeat domain-containing protein [Salinibacter altiplanensis]|uniref:HEAT repeat domain-containing protein n=1 Tax=Salinibacter altiplanensis TaxID=1803181 RepID=UPI000C9FC51B|nr:HEAT repeat domain-containing protein [Salinibacter altiplanensis]